MPCQAQPGHEHSAYRGGRGSWSRRPAARRWDGGVGRLRGSSLVRRKSGSDMIIADIAGEKI